MADYIAGLVTHHDIKEEGLRKQDRNNIGYTVSNGYHHNWLRLGLL